MEKLHQTLRIRLAKDEIFFGPGVLKLLLSIQEQKSLNAASKIMNLSYSKAFKMIKNAEEALGFKLIHRKIGGAGGGGSNLTPECIEFINQYIEYEKALTVQAEILFKQYFSKYIKND